MTDRSLQRTLSVVLELPVVQTKYNSAWAPHICRLLVVPCATHSASALRDCLGGVLRVLSTPDECLYAHPLGCLLADQKVARIAERFAEQNPGVLLAKSYWLFRCSTQDLIPALMAERGFEGLVLFFSPTWEIAVELVQNASINADLEDSRYETPFLQFCDRFGGFIFFASGHEDLEILGSRSFVFDRCFRTIFERGLINVE